MKYKLVVDLEATCCKNNELFYNNPTIPFY